MKPYLTIPLLLFLIAGAHDHARSEENTDCNIYTSPFDKIHSLNKGENFKIINSRSEDASNGPYVIINHIFTYNNPTTKYTITVKGEIFINEDDHREVRCCSGTDTMIVSMLSGSGTVKVYGRGSMNMGSFQVEKLNYDSDMNIVIKGKTHCLDKPGADCYTKYSSISFEESWSKEMEWDITTSDPENDDIRYDMLKRIAPTQIPVSPHTGRTLRFDYNYPGPGKYEQTSTAHGIGTYKWSYTYVSGNAARYSSDINPHTEQLNYDDDQPKPKDYPVPVGVLGPPLENITWDLIDLDY